MVCRIGITCGWREGETRHYLHDEFVQVVQAAGGVPLLLPTVEPELAGQLYDCVDGLIFSGGEDPDPWYYGEEPQNGLGEITPRRDSFELALARLTLAGKKPALAICRGVQVWNIAAGGTLYQDLAGVTIQQHRQQAPRWYAVHQVDIEAGSLLFGLLQKDSHRVNSFHHQGIQKVGAELKAVAWSRDGLVEAIEARNPAKWLLGVQWHPECSWDREELSFRLFKHLVEEAHMRSEM